MQLECLPDTTLRSLTRKDAAAVLAILDIDREQFDPWLRWSDAVTTIALAENFIAEAAERERVGNGFHLGIWQADVLLGGVACWWINAETGVSEIGYWLAINARGKGLAFHASQTVVNHLFSARHVTAVELQCLLNNEASRALAERLGGQFTEIRNQSCAADSPARDHAVYTIPSQAP